MKNCSGDSWRYAGAGVTDYTTEEGDRLACDPKNLAVIGNTSLARDGEVQFWRPEMRSNNKSDEANPHDAENSELDVDELDLDDPQSQHILNDFMREMIMTVMPNALPFEQKVMEPTDRNLPCPCGSGKKYKRCHGTT